MRGLVKIFKAALLVLLNLVFLCVGLGLAICPAKRYRLRAGARYMSSWARWSCAIMGVRVRRTGLDRTPPGSFVVANHCSYLDILVLGSLLPAVFVAKKEVESWFLLGPLARLAGTVFVNRTSRRETISATKEIENRLSSCISVIVFPEGTTNNSMDMMAFKSPFFKIPVEVNCSVLPISLIYSHINEKPVSEEERDCIAWHGAMSFLPHFWNILGMDHIDVRVHFNRLIQDIIAFTPAHARKVLCIAAHESVRSGWESLQREGIENADVLI